MISGGLNNNLPVIPALYGLVLAGGKSVRMGLDKGGIKWHGEEQRYYIARLVGSICDQVFISCRQEQVSEFLPSFHLLPDSFKGAGPLCGILSAFEKHPGVAWLVVACDLPLLDINTLHYLEVNRDATKIATTFESPFDGLPEPLVTIWEPGSASVLSSFFKEGFNCPRKALIRNSDNVKILKAPDPVALMNANTPGDAGQVRKILGNTHV